MMLVTTSQKASADAIAEAMQTALRFGWVYMERRTLSLAQLRERLRVERELFSTSESIQTLVLANGVWNWYPDEQSGSVFFHPSMAHVRVKRLMKGESDVLLEVASLQQGESVLDCTAGMASDSIVFSHAVGETGSVTALESTVALAFLLERGLQTYDTSITPLQRAMRAIHVVQRNHLPFLMEQKDRSFDVVYFDPMFRQPLKDANVIDPLRSAVNADSLQLRAVQEAIRVARRLVIMKETRCSAEFERLGFRVERKSSGKISYGVIRI
jgi:16S rRNA G966 N2-methylase RsmD